MGILSVWVVLVLVSFCSSVPPAYSNHLCLRNQRDALLHFKNSISVIDDCESHFDSKPKTKSWNKSIDCCSWEGVKCHNLTGHVIRIDLSSSCLNGSLLANSSLFHLLNLQWLDLSNNYLKGSLQDNTSRSLFHLHRLQRLNLANNSFDGDISSELFTQLVSLTHLDLSYNLFSGLIPYEISLLSSLVSLELSFNGDSKLRFDGQGFDMLATNLTKLTNLVLDSVDMSDVALTSFQNLPSSLEILSLPYCHLHGEFPPQPFQLPNLELLDLSSNNLSGSIPDSFFDLVKLILLDLSSNNLSGVVKSNMLSKLTSLETLDVSNNGLLSLSTSGSIDVNYSFPQIVQVIFSGCSVRQFPSFFRTSYLMVLDLSNNKITGGISKWEAQGWEDLQVLNISHNFLTSLEQIPGKNLRFLDLNSNLLQGTILDLQIPSPRSLNVLSISDNKLTGSITTRNTGICNGFLQRILSVAISNGLATTLQQI